MKLFLLGAPGAGTSRVAARLAAQHRCPVLDFDRFSPDAADDISPRPNGPPPAAFLGPSGWIAAGVCRPALLPVLPHADLIVAYAPRVWLRQLRLVRSFLRRETSGAFRPAALRDLRRSLARGRWYDEEEFPVVHALLVRRNLPYARCTTFAEVRAAVVAKTAPSVEPPPGRAYRWRA